MSGSGLPHDQTKSSGENGTVILKYSIYKCSVITFLSDQASPIYEPLRPFLKLLMDLILR